MPVRAPAPVMIGTVERPYRAAACPWGRPPSRGASSPLHAADLQKSRRELGARTLVFVLEEDVRFRPRLRLDPLGPRLQLAFFVGLLAQAEIAVAGGCMQRRLFLVGIRHAERHVVRPQHFEHLVILKPRRVPELEGGAGSEGAERAADPAD